MLAEKPAAAMAGSAAAQNVDTKAVEEVYLDIDPDEFPLERYKPMAVIGKGALGEVFLCRDQFLRKKVAVKKLLKLTDESIMDFQNEAKIISKLKHENIIRVLDFGTTNSGRPFMVMEYFQGKSLQEVLIDAGQLLEEDAIELFISSADSLSYLHENGILHRDLKPSNILLSGTEHGIEIRLIDFGLSKATQDVQSKTLINGNTLVGTPAYMSPDQIRGEKYDVPSEIYSLGCIMFESVTGVPPYSGDTALAVLNSHVSDDIPEIQRLNPDVSNEFVRLIEKCLSKRKEQRFESMMSVRDQLLLLRETIVARSDFPAQTTDISDQTSHRPEQSGNLDLGLFLVNRERSSWKFPVIVAVVLTSVLIVFWQLMKQNDRDTEIGAVINSHTIAPIAAESLPMADYSESEKFTLAIYHVKKEDNLPERLAELKRPVKNVIIENQIIDQSNIDLICSKVVTHLTLKDCGTLSGDVLREVATISSLNVLALEGSKFSASAFRELASTPNLEVLNLSGCNLKDEHLRVLESFPHLSQITIFNNNDLDDKTLRDFRIRLEGRRRGILFVRVDRQQMSRLKAMFPNDSLSSSRSCFIDEETENDIRKTQSHNTEYLEFDLQPVRSN